MDLTCLLLITVFRINFVVVMTDLAMTVEKNVFVGYSEESTAYKLHNPQTKKLVLSRDVFDEATTWKWDNIETSMKTIALWDGETLTHLRNTTTTTIPLSSV